MCLIKDFLAREIIFEKICLAKIRLNSSTEFKLEIDLS